MSSLDRMKTRFAYVAGEPGSDSNVREKYLSFKSAINDPYQSETITLLNAGGDPNAGLMMMSDAELDPAPATTNLQFQCLLNPDQLKESYDIKEISIDKSSGMKVGDVFYWNRTDTYWLVYLQEQTEEAYFRASVLKCNHQINNQWVYLKGPGESSTNWNNKHDIVFNDLNYKILFYITATKENLETFKRNAVIKLKDPISEYEEEDIYHNWKVVAVDKYSQPGIIEVYIDEYFDNEFADASSSAAEGSVEESTPQDPMQPYIAGPAIVNGFDSNIAYSIVGISGGKFITTSNKVKIKQADENITSCKINILTSAAGQFDLKYITDDDEITLSIVIKSI